jgi:hypothetical protein
MRRGPALADDLDFGVLDFGIADFGIRVIIGVFGGRGPEAALRRENWSAGL